jgi:polar amino acid transport system permease protein
MGSFLEQLSQSWGNIGSALVITVEGTIGGAALAFVLAFVLGLMALSRFIVVRGVARTIIEFFRGTSLYVQLFWLYFALPVLGFKIASALLVAIIAFGLNFGAYGAEVVRGAINAVPRAQWEGAIALNMSPFQRMRLVILPQAWVGMIPPFNNLLIQLLKSTPLMSLVTIADLTFEAQQLRAATGQTAWSYLFLLVVYFILAYVLTLLMNALESVAKARLGRGTGLRGVFRLRPADPTGKSLGAGLTGAGTEVDQTLGGGR